jgi:hypothetical protein
MCLWHRWVMKYRVIYLSVGIFGLTYYRCCKHCKKYQIHIGTWREGNWENIPTPAYEQELTLDY